MATVVFESTESYSSNSDDPEQDAWYQTLGSHLAADREWFDGTPVAQRTA
jgi:hypothetical protein